MPFNVMEKPDPPEPSTGKRDSKSTSATKETLSISWAARIPHDVTTAALSRVPSGAH